MLYLGFVIGRLRPVLVLDLLRTPFGVPGFSEPRVESGTLLPWEGFRRPLA